LKLEDLGRAKKITIDKDNTTIVAGPPARPARSKARIKQLRVQVEEGHVPITTRKKLQERLAKLVGGGSQSSRWVRQPRPSLKEKKGPRVERTRCTLLVQQFEEGIVPGRRYGSTSAVLPALEKLKLDDDEAIGGETS